MADNAFEEDTQRGQYLTFRLADEEFAVEIRDVVEIINIMDITKIPEVPPFVKGVINLRNKIIPVIDMRLKLHMESVDYDERTCIVIVDVGDFQAGLIVDRVLEVIRIQDENIEPPPAFKASVRRNYLKGIGKTEDKIFLIIRCEELLTEEEIEEISAAM